MMSTTLTEFEGLKQKLKATWEDGNYDYFSRFMESSAVQFLDKLNVPAGAGLLDVACGSGQLALIAARRGALVTGVDIAANAIEAARGRARAEDLDARFDEGDAESLPYSDARFDVVTSLFGAMFAPRPDLAAAEMLRVCRPGGTIAMANWTPEGFIGRMFKAIARFIAPSGMPSPVLWGDPRVVAERFGSGLSVLRTRRVLYRFDYPFGPEDVVEFFRQNYGPATRAFASLGKAESSLLRASLTELWASSNQATEPGRTLVDAEYLEVTGIRSEPRKRGTTDSVSTTERNIVLSEHSRAEALASRIEQGAEALSSFAEGLSEQQWQAVVRPEGRTVGVLVHHVASVYPIEVRLAAEIAAGKAVEEVTWDAVAEMNATHAQANATVSRAAAVALLRENSKAAAAAVRAFTDAQLDSAAAFSLNAGAPLTAQFVIEDHALRHSWHHLAKIRAALFPA